ncbi:hypothetical protein F5148DRAFT_1199963 [Russula earlei]|uniref:Uncharacterized protein n=1 Tax=Russula earlei TaxID=71964 RepID=A0ACC0UB04_9AGAM|nr:hypothetical protein F5148DRAFT_1199963 [Russula earlei]
MSSMSHQLEDDATVHHPLIRKNNHKEVDSLQYKANACHSNSLQLCSQSLRTTGTYYRRSSSPTPRHLRRLSFQKSDSYTTMRTSSVFVIFCLIVRIAPSFALPGDERPTSDQNVDETRPSSSGLNTRVSRKGTLLELPWDKRLKIYRANMSENLERDKKMRFERMLEKGRIWVDRKL